MKGYCYNCAAALTAEAQVCPRCGYDSRNYRPEPHHLLPETILAGRYRIGRVLGGGGFGITYVGIDTVLDLKVAIKEFYMTGFVSREALRSPELRITGGTYGEDFIRNRDRFLDEARVLARFASEPGIVMVRDFFTANNTAYIVMEFLDGETLAAHLKKAGPLSWAETHRLMRPVLETLSRIHRHDIIHRDISPDNIMMTSLGQVKLLDFGAARDYSGQADHSLSVILKHGYAPVEQNSRNRGIQGPWTDVYALCATMYRCLTGKVPEDAMERVNEDTVKTPRQLGCCSRPVSDVLMKGLELRRKDRWQSADELAAALEQANAMPADRPFFAPQPAADGDATVYAGKAASDADATVFAGKAAAPKQPPKAEPQSAAPRQPKAEPKQNVPPKREAAPQQKPAAQPKAAEKPADVSELFGRFFDGSAAKPAAEKPAAKASSVQKPAAASAAPPAKAKNRGLKIFGLVMLALYAYLILRASVNAIDLVDYWLETSFPNKVPVTVPTVAAVGYSFVLLLCLICWVTNFLCLTTVARKPGKPFRKPLEDRKKRQTVFGLILCVICTAAQLLCILSGEDPVAYAYTLPMFASVPLWTMVRCCVLPPERTKFRKFCIHGLMFLGLTVYIFFSSRPYQGLISLLFAVIPMLMLAVLAFCAPKKQAAAPAYRYFTCTGCQKKLRVPFGKGRIRVKCPNCGKEFEMRT